MGDGETIAGPQQRRGEVCTRGPEVALGVSHPCLLEPRFWDLGSSLVLPGPSLLRDKKALS